VADVAGAIKAAAKRIRNQDGDGGGGGGGNCSSAYPDFCIPPPPPDLDCDDVNGQNFTVRSPDPHGFDSDGDGVGCES
jgi:micrococcal nuclease